MYEVWHCSIDIKDEMKELISCGKSAIVTTLPVNGAARLPEVSIESMHVKTRFEREAVRVIAIVGLQNYLFAS